MELFHILADNVSSPPSGRGLSPLQITPSNYGRAAGSFQESVLLTSLQHFYYMREKTVKEWSNLKKSKGGRNGEKGYVCGRREMREKTEKRDDFFGEFLEFYTTLGFYKVQMNEKHSAACASRCTNYPRGLWGEGSVNEH